MFTIKNKCNRRTHQKFHWRGTITPIAARTSTTNVSTMRPLCYTISIPVLQCLFIWSLLIGRQHTLVAQGQIISVIPGVEPSAFPSASPTVYSIKVPPVPTMEPTPTTIAPNIGPNPSITFAPIPIVQATLPPWMVPTSQKPTSVPTGEATDAPSSVPVLNIVNTTTNSPTMYAPTAGISPSTEAPALASPTANGNTTNLDRDGSDSSNNLIVKIIIPIMVVAAVFLSFGLYVSCRPKRNKKEKRQSQTPGIMSDRDLDFDPNRPDGGNSVFDDASIYTTSIIAGFSSSKYNTSKIVAKNEMSTSSVGGVINQDFTDKTEASNEDIYENDEVDDYIGDLTSENRTMASSCAISSVTPNSFENRQIGYMEEGKMIQERYGRINRELYSSEKLSPRSDTSDIVLQARTLLVSQSVNDTKNPHSPISEEGVEITFRNEKSDHTAQYDDIVGVDNTSTMSFETSNASSGIRADHPVDTAMSVNSGKILDMLTEENYTSTDQLHDFDDPTAVAKNRTVQPQTNPLSTIALFTRGRNKKGPFGKSNSKKVADHSNNNMSQYKTDEPYPMMVPSIVDSANNDDHSSMIEPFSELTTDFQYGEHDSVGSNDAHIVLESIREGATGLSSSCDSSVNNTHVYENDTDSTNASVQFDNHTQRVEYNLNLPLDFNGPDDGSTNSQFDNLYESMSNEWEWKQPSQTIMNPITSTSIDTTTEEDQYQQQSSNKSTGSSAEEVVRELGNIFLV